MICTVDPVPYTLKGGYGISIALIKYKMINGARVQGGFECNSASMSVSSIYLAFRAVSV